MDFLDRNTLVAQRFKVNNIISSGNFGMIYQSYDIINCNFVSVKVEKYDEQQYKVSQRESGILNFLSEVVGIPRLIWFGKDQNYTYIVTQLLGRTLSDIMKEKKLLPLQVICDIAIQLIKILSSVHSNFILHRDIKPKNIVFGINNQKDLLYLVEFGISQSLNDQNKNLIQSARRPIQTGKPFIGSKLYGSIASHLGQEQGKKDDLESLGYVLIFLFKGNLPWQRKYESSINKQIQIGEQKQNIQLSKLCENLPNQFMRYFEHCRMLKFDENPDYFYLQQLFIQMQQNIQTQSQYQSQSQSFHKITPGKINQINLINDFNSGQQSDSNSINIEKTKKGEKFEQQTFLVRQQSLKSQLGIKASKITSQSEIEKINQQKLKLFQSYLNAKAQKGDQGQNSQSLSNSQNNFNFIHQQLSGNYQDDEIRMHQIMSNDDMNENNDLDQKIKKLVSPLRTFTNNLP